MNHKTNEEKWREARFLKERLDVLLSELYEYDDAAISALLERRLAVASEVLGSKMEDLKASEEF